MSAFQRGSTQTMVFDGWFFKGGSTQNRWKIFKGGEYTKTHGFWWGFGIFYCFLKLSARGVYFGKYGNNYVQILFIIRRHSGQISWQERREEDERTGDRPSAVHPTGRSLASAGNSSSTNIPLLSLRWMSARLALWSAILSGYIHVFPRICLKELWQYVQLSDFLLDYHHICNINNWSVVD